MKRFGFPQIARGGDGGSGGSGGAGESGMDAFGMALEDPTGFNVDNFSDPQGFGLGAFLDQDFGYGLDQNTDPGNLEFGHAAFGSPPGSPGSSFDEVGFNIDFGQPDAPGFSSFDEAGFGGLGAAPGGFADAWGGLGLGYNSNPGPSNPEAPQGFPAHRGVWGVQFGMPEWIDIPSFPQGTPSTPSNVAFGFPGAHGDVGGTSLGGFGPSSTPGTSAPTSAPSAPSATPGFSNAQVGAPMGYEVGGMSFGGDPGGRMAWHAGAGNVAAPTSVGDFGYILPNGQWQQSMPQGGAYAFMDPTGQWSRYNTPNSPHSPAITPWPNDPNTPSATDFAMNAPSSFLIGQGYKYYDPASGPAPRQFAGGERISAAGSPIYGDWNGGYFYR